MRIGLIADTHNLLRPEALAALQGVDHLIHAGDIGGPHILADLERIAPLSVVRGNNDQDSWADAIPERLTLRFGAIALHVLHDLKQLDIDPAAQGIDVVIAGHSHKPLHESATECSTSTLAAPGRDVSSYPSAWALCISRMAGHGPS